MTRLPISAFSHRLVLEQPIATADGGGGASVAWETVCELWGAIHPVTGDERLAADAVAGRVTHRITLRRRQAVNPSLRLREGTRIFEITAILDAGARAHLVCLCEERNL